MSGSEGLRVDGIVRVRTPRPPVVSLSSETHQVGIYLYRNRFSENGGFYEPEYAQYALACSG